MKVLLSCDIIGVLLTVVVSSREPRYVEVSHLDSMQFHEREKNSILYILFSFQACLCCLRTLFNHPEAPVEVLYADHSIIPHLLVLMPLSTSNQISVASILMNR